MTKWILAIAMMVGGFAAASTDTTDTTDVGTCSYTCTSNNVTYINRAQCKAACSGACVVEAC